MSDENYLRLEGVLKAKTERGVLIETADGEGWVARSCLHAATDEAVKESVTGREMEFQVMEWAARKAGIA